MSIGYNSRVLDFEIQVGTTLREQGLDFSGNGGFFDKAEITE